MPRTEPNHEHKQPKDRKRSEGTPPRTPPGAGAASWHPLRSSGSRDGAAGGEQVRRVAYTKTEQTGLVIGPWGAQVKPQVLHLPHWELMNGDGHTPHLIILVKGMVLKKDSCQLLVLWLVH